MENSFTDMINEEKLTRFLEGRNSKKYIVGVEVPYGSNEVSLIINDPEKGKFISKDEFQSFIWFKEEITKIMFGGKRVDIQKNMKKFGVTMTKLKVNVAGGHCPKRMDRGYKYMAKCNGSYSKLLKFFKDGGIDVYGESHKRYFVAISPIEQYLISSGRRLFKGMDDYDDLHRLQFDLETTGLYPKGALLSPLEIKEVRDRASAGENISELYEFDENHNPIRYKDAEIFQIGVKDNRGFEEIFEISLGSKKERNDSEIYVMFKLFETIKNLEPDTIVGYNSENFDWDFIFTRCEILGLEIEYVAKTLDKTGYHKIKRVDKSIKLGGEREFYKQTVLWGYNVLDASHAVRRAKAINSNQKAWGLKYITKFAELNKKNRVYVDGNKIYSTWADNESEYAFNDIDGDWYKITPETPIKEGYVGVLGKTIIRRYLLDDLWETEKVDEEFNQASFLLSKIIPTSYMRSTTMGTAGIWKLIMLAWSYENRLAIPDIMPQKTFTGGLSRLLEVGYAKNVAKLDYAALYPNIELTHDIFPDTDITGVMKGMLLYIASTRDKYKGLMNTHKDEKKKMEAFIDSSLDISSSELKLVEGEIERHGSLARMYDKKQLPIKILGNSFFGSLGAPNIFNWGDTHCAEETTCRARQYLRLMVLFFVNKGFRPLVGDTDGFNFAIPNDVHINTYTPKGTHRFTENDKNNSLFGLDGVVAEFNELYMIGRMGLDIDDVCKSTINFSRKNYANLIGNKIKLVGNTIKSSKMPIYIEEFLDDGIKFLLDGKGYEFIELYHETVEKIYNFQIPLVKIASKSNVKQSVSAYIADMKTKTKAGNFKAKKAHMELIIRDKLITNLGDTIYYVNTGLVKSHGDVKVVTDKETGKRSVNLQCMRIPTDQIENNPELTTSEYNVPKYLEAFNKRIRALLVCFKPEIRDDILISMVKNKKTREMELTDINIFTRKDCELSNGIASKDGDQDTMEELMTMEDKEIEFWININKEPNNLKELDFNWQEIQDDYIDRRRIARLEGIKEEKRRVLSIAKRLEISEINQIKKTTMLTTSLEAFATFTVHKDKEGNPNIYLKSNNWEVDLASVQDLFKYEGWAKQRAEFYLLEENVKNHTYLDWLKHIWHEAKNLNNVNKAYKISIELLSVGVNVDALIADYAKNKEKEKV